MRREFLALLAALAAGFAQAAPPAAVVVYKVPDVTRLRLFLRDAAGHDYGSLAAVDAAVTASGHQLAFAMNAGMYDRDRSPTGLAVADGRELRALNTLRRLPDGSTPNFYLPPNGVFAIARGRPMIVATPDWASSPPAGVTLATQSGPLLLAHGAIVAPAVAIGTDAVANQWRRNGVCVNGNEVLLVEADAMTLHQFAVHLRDVLHCQDALYLDGVISAVWDSRSGRHDVVDAGNPLGPILGVLAP